MCGIFGATYFDQARVPDPERLAASLRSLGHRGPDGQGQFVDPGIGLAHTRLALLDLNVRGNQPFVDPSDRYVLVFNGEIYNFRELRSELEERGVEFTTTTDTEVLLHSLIQDGVEKTVGRLEGMFAFGFYDRKTRALCLARDRYGIKPLVISTVGEALLFASEVKALAPWMELRPDPFHLSAYLVGSPVPTSGSCFFQDVTIVPPGSIVTLEPGAQPIIESFYGLADHLDPARAEALAGLSDEAAIDRVDAELQRSVDLMLLADAPVGALCSGGVDSSVIMAMAARKHSNLAIFHADVVGPHSEVEAARELAAHLGLDLRTVQVRDDDFRDLIPEVSAAYEQPFDYHPNSAPFLQVAQLVRSNEIKAVLSGEGADECFLGYQFLVQEPMVLAYERLRKRVQHLARSLPLVGSLLVPGVEDPDGMAHALLGGFEREQERERLDEAYREKQGENPSRSLSLHMLGYHLRTLLHRNDRLGMAASVEARFPFLHEPFVHTAVNLPMRHKIRFDRSSRERRHPLMTSKWVLRRVADRYLPRTLSRRKKLGFPVTAFERLHVHDAYFGKAPLRDLLGLGSREMEFLLGHANPGLRLKLLLLDAWTRQCVEGRDSSELRAHLQEHVSFAS